MTAVTTTVAPYKVLLDGDDVTREEWLEARRAGIGGSDAPAVLGWGGFHSALDVYADKVSGIHDDSGTEEQQWGQLLEDVIAQEWARRNGVGIRKGPALVQSTRWPHMVASVDRIEIDLAGGQDVGIIECKNRSGWVSDEWETLPADVTAQGLHYAAVYGLHRVDVACLVGGNELRTFTIDADDDVIEALAVAEGEWWENHVVARTLPPLNPIREEAGALARIYPNPGGVLDLDDAGVNLLRLRWLAHQEYTAAKQARGEIDDRVRALLGDRVEGLVGGKKFVSWSPSAGQRSCDYDRLQRDFPDAYAACVTPGEPTRRLTYARKEIPS
jgi:putative phage-type endonuclease